MNIIFSSPSYLWFLLGIPLLIFIHFQSMKVLRRRALRFANFDAIKRILGTGHELSKNTLLLLRRCASLLFIVLAMSGISLWYTGYGSNTDFVIAIDTSNSMETTDFEPNRISAALDAAKHFIDMSPANSRVGIVTFSGSPAVIQTLTDDKVYAKQKISEIFVSVTGGTNIGDAILTSSNVLLESNNSRAVILLTDGQSNIGTSIQDATDYANKNGVIVHAIGIGTEEGGKIEGTDIYLKLNEEELVEIAVNTKGNYYRAKSGDSLKYSFEDIAQMGETKIKLDLSLIFVTIVCVLLMVEWFMINTKYRTIP